MRVIPIITLHAAILFPVFDSPRRNARRNTCPNDLMQNALGIEHQVQDYAVCYQSSHAAIWNAACSDTVDNGDPVLYSTALGYRGPLWWSTIYPYTKSYQLVICPSHKAGGVASSTTIKPSYGMNRMFS